MMTILFLLFFSGLFTENLFRRYFGDKLWDIKCFNLLASLFIFLLLFYDIKTTIVPYISTLSSWIIVDTLNDNCWFCFDSLTSITLVVVTLISLLDHIYSTEYMENDSRLFLFMGFLSSFTFFMLVITTSNNFLQMFVGWKSVRLALYLLITSSLIHIPTNKAAIRDMLVDMIRELFILLVLLVIYLGFNDLVYNLVCDLIPSLIHH
jgi:NADH-quinone oxidoreductase subunit L